MSLRKQLAGLKQQTFQNGAQIKKENGDTHQNKKFGSQDIKLDPCVATIAPEGYRYPDEAVFTLGIASNSMKELPSTEHSKESYRCSGQSNSSISSTCSNPRKFNSDPHSDPHAYDNSIVRIEKTGSGNCSASNSSCTGIVPTDLVLNDSRSMSKIVTTAATANIIATQSVASSTISSIPSAPQANATVAADHISPLAAAATATAAATTDVTLPTATVLANSRHRAFRVMDLLLLYQNFLMTVALLPLNDGVSFKWPYIDSSRDNKYESQVIGRSRNGDNVIDPDISLCIQAVQQLFNSMVGGQGQGQQAHAITSATTCDSSADLCVVQLTSALCHLIQKLALSSLSDVDTRHPKYDAADGKSPSQKLQLRTRKDSSKRYIQHEISNSLLRCLALLGGVIDYMSADAVSAVRRARSLSLKSVLSKISRRSDSRGKVDSVISSVVDLNETFDKIAGAGIADVNHHKWPCNHKSKSTDDTRYEQGAGATKETTPTAPKHSHRLKRQAMESPLKSELKPDLDSVPIDVSDIPRDVRVGTGSSGAGRGLGSGMKHIVTFADGSHITPVLKGSGSDRSMSGDESATQSVSTAFDCGFPTQKRARIKSIMTLNSYSRDDNCTSPSTFPLSCLKMPGLSANDLKEAYHDATSVTTAAADDSSRFPKVNSDPLNGIAGSVVYPRISPGDEHFADLPGALARTLGGLIALIRSLGTLNLSSVPAYTSTEDDMVEASRGSTDNVILTFRQTLSDAATAILNKVFLGK